MLLRNHPGRIGSGLAPVVATWLVWVSLLGVLLWSANKSLAMQDEGSLLLSYQHPAETINSSTHFALIVTHLFGWLHPGVVMYRILKLLLSIGSLAVFALGLSRWMQHLAGGHCTRWAQLRFLFPFVAIGDLFGYGMFGQTLSYNSLNDNILLVCYGILLLTFASPPRRSLLRSGAYVLVGALEGLEFFIKFSSSVVFISTCVIMVMLVGNSVRWWERVTKAVLLSCGYALGMAIFFWLFLDFSTWAVNFRSGLSNLTSASHNPHELLTDTTGNLVLMLSTLAIQTIVSATLFHVLSRLTGMIRRPWVTRLFVTAASLLVTLAVAALAVQESVQRTLGGWGSILGFATVIAVGCGLILICAPVSIAHLADLVKRHRQAIGITLFLCAAPLIGAIGSNIAFITAGDSYMAFWCAVVAVLLLATHQLPRRAGIIPVFWAVPMALVVGLIAEGLVLHPFGILTTLFAQTQTVTQSGDLRGLAVDGNTKRFFRTVRRLITANSDYRLGDPIVSAYDLPGLVYVLGGVSPGAPWFFADGPQQRRNCIELRSTHLTTLSRAIVIVQPVIWPSFSACLRAVKIGFPGHYRLAGTIRSPYDGQVVKVYVPLVGEQKRKED